MAPSQTAVTTQPGGAPQALTPPPSAPPPAPAVPGTTPEASIGPAMFDPARATNPAAPELSGPPDRLVPDPVDPALALATPRPDVANEFGFASFLAQADLIILAVLGILLLMSVATWYLITNNGVRAWVLRRRATQVVQRFWAAESLAQAMGELDHRRGRDAFSELLRQGLSSDAHYRKHHPQTLGEACTHSEFVTRSLRQSIDYATARLEAGLTVLASVGSTAPFVGLLGTVWGIYHALIRIGVSGKATLGQVAGPVGEALIMTAVGLAVAIPAVLAYNAFVRANRIILAQLDGLAHDLHAFLTTGARVESNPERKRRGLAPERATVVQVTRGKT